MLSLKSAKVISFPSSGRRLLAITVALAFVGLSIMAGTPAVSVSQEGKGYTKFSMRFQVETDETATFYVGQPGKFKVVLRDQYGNRLDSPRDLETTITITTLGNLDQAREWMASRSRTQQQYRPPVSKSRERRITLAQGQEAAQMTIIHRQGEEDVNVYFLSNHPGLLYIFAESPGVARGGTAVAVLKSKGSIQRRIFQPFDSVSSTVRMMPIQWRPDLASQFKLDLVPARPTNTQINQAEQVENFKVVLQSATDELVAAPHDLVVILRVDNGYARFEPDTLTIPEGQAITPKPATLRTRAGGSITVSASSTRINNARVVPVTRTYEYTPGIHSTTLSVQKERDNACANGRDEIILRVQALQDGRAITPEEEGMEERKVFFHFIGDSRGVKFENGSGEVTIPKGSTDGTIKLFSVRSVGNLKIVAESWNGLRNRITSAADGVPVMFYFPWIQLLWALVGGLVFPLLSREDPRGWVKGIALGGVFFGLALLGAISGPQQLGPVGIAVTKLPTESAFASFILGFVGSTLLRVIFIQVQRARTASGTG